MAETLSAAVGPGQPNREHDVKLVQRLLDRQAGVLSIRLIISGRFDLSLERAILRFQRQQLRQLFADGVVRPNDNTYWRLTEVAPVQMLAGALGGILLVPIMGDSSFSEEDFQKMGQELSCEARTVKTVNAVESQFGPYDKAGRPSILFERHLFANMTFHRYDARYPFISSLIPGGYYLPEGDQYRRLQQAFALDREAASKATSWGGFQILGKNHVAAGYGTVTQFVQAMCRSKDEQCDAFVTFIKSDHVLWQALQQKNWPVVARHYNGSNYRSARPPYDVRLEDAYAAQSE